MLRNGPTLDAARRFRAALRTPNRQLAAVRLGDIALATGDPTTALGWYRRAGSLGVFGRVSRMRECEIAGACLGATDELLKIFDPAGLPPPVKKETVLRTIRAELYQDRFASAQKILFDRISDGGYARLCDDSVDRLCRRFLLEIIRNKAVGGESDDAVANEQAATRQVVDARRGDAKAAQEEERARAEDALTMYLALPNW